MGFMTNYLFKLARLRRDLHRLREERGATDPILIIAGIAITLILLVGGSFAISGFIANANNLNAKGDLDRIATAQAAYLGTSDGYAPLRLNMPSGATTKTLLDGPISFTPTAGNPLIVNVYGSNGWAAVTKSASGEVFVRFSSSTKVYSLGSGSTFPTTLPAGYAAEADALGATTWVTQAFNSMNGK